MSFHFGPSQPDKDRGEKVERRCPTCRKKVLAKSWYAQKAGLHFCSAACRAAWAREERSFEVRLEGAGRPRGANWQMQADKARQRDAFTCQVCGVTEEELGRQLDVHHRIPFRRFRSNVEANKLEHLISVCPSCHARLESQLRQELPLFGQ
jgi:5-methylcytosine-specific restriction endonuclease McrA